MSNGNVLITQKGLEFILSAHSVGPLIYLKYFIPVYDDRFDNTIRSNGVLSAFSAVADKDILEPYGEKLWRVDQGYTLSDSGKFMISATAYTPESLTDTYQKTSVQTNLLNGKPISNQISATSWELTIDNDPLYNWTSIGGAAVTGTSHKATTTTADYYKIKNYYPVYNDLSVNEIRGSFKCIIDEDTGNIKFNKIALYAVQLDSDGITELEHCFFGEAYLGYSPAIRSNLGQGYNKFEFDIQIDLSGVNATFDDLFYSSSADYWSRSPGGLYYPNRIGIGMFDDNVKEIKASLHLKRTREDIAANIPLLKLNYDNDKYTDINIVSTSYDVTNTNPITSAGGGDIVLSFCSNTIGQYPSYIGDAIAIRPYIGSTYTLGTSASQFRELHLKNPVIITKDTSSKIPLVINNQMKNYAVNINDGQVYLGNISGSLNTTSADPFGIRLNNIGVNIVTTTTATNADPRGSFKGGDLWRDGHDLLIYNTSANGTESIYMFAGLKMTGTDAITAVGGATHKNILSEIEKTSHHLFCDSNLKLSNTAEIKIGAKGKLGLYGPIELGNSNNDAKNTAIIRTTIDGDGYGDYRLFIGVGVNSLLTMAQISTIIDDNSFETLSESPFIDSVDFASQIYLISKKLIIDSDAIPYATNIYSLGSEDNVWNKLWIKSIQVKGVDGSMLISDYSITLANNSDVTTTIGTSDRPFNSIFVDGMSAVDSSVTFDGGLDNQTLSISSKTIDEGQQIGIFINNNETNSIGSIGENNHRFLYGYFSNIHSIFVGRDYSLITQGWFDTIYYKKLVKILATEGSTTTLSVGTYENVIEYNKQYSFEQVGINIYFSATESEVTIKFYGSFYINENNHSPQNVSYSYITNMRGDFLDYFDKIPDGTVITGDTIHVNGYPNSQFPAKMPITITKKSSLFEVSVNIFNSELVNGYNNITFADTAESSTISATISI